MKQIAAGLVLFIGIGAGAGLVNTSAQPAPRQPAQPSTRPAQAPVPAKEPATPRGWIAKAEELEQLKKFPEAAAAREKALAATAEREAQCRQWLEKADARLRAEPPVPEAEQRFAKAWSGRVQIELQRLLDDRAACQGWLDELKKPGAGIIPAVNPERLIVWARERDLLELAARVKKLEIANKWADAHSRRREWLIAIAANVRFYKAKREAQETVFKNMKNSSSLDKNQKADFEKTMTAKISYYKNMEDAANAECQRAQAQVAREQTPEHNAAEAEFWAALPGFASAYGIPADFANAEKCKAASALAQARADYYIQRAKEKEKPQEPPKEPK